jgi:hypothetical protein
MKALSLVDRTYLVAITILGQITDPTINQNFPGAGQVATWLGGLKFLALSACLASLFLGGGAWGFATLNGNGSTWGRRFAFGGAVGAIIVGLGADIVNNFAGLSATTE